MALIACLAGGSALAGGIKDRIKARRPAVMALLGDGTLGENNQGFLEFKGAKKQADVVAAENKDRSTVYQPLPKKQARLLSWSANDALPRLLSLPAPAHGFKTQAEVGIKNNPSP